MDMLEDLAGEIEDREQQLSVLETLLIDQKMQRDIFLAGRPVKKGWMSSRFVSELIPLAAIRRCIRVLILPVIRGRCRRGCDRGGSLCRRAERLRQMVEINHGGGYITRYGHHRNCRLRLAILCAEAKLLVLWAAAADRRAHVHFEVYKNGRVSIHLPIFIALVAER